MNCKKITAILLLAMSCPTMAFAEDTDTAGTPRVSADTVATGTPRLVVLDKELDLGSFYGFNKRFGQIRVKNEGDAPLLIQSVRGNCGCTVVKFRHDSIMPDSIGFVNIRFDGSNRPSGRFRKMIKIRSNSPQKVDVAFITGEVLK